MHARQEQYDVDGNLDCSTNQTNASIGGSEGRLNDNSQISHSEREKLDQLSSAFTHISQHISKLAVNIADTSGTVGDVTDTLTSQVKSLEELLSSVEALNGRNRAISDVASTAIETATKVESELKETTKSIETFFSTSSQDIKRMAETTTQTIEEFGDIKKELTEVHSHSESIQKISTQTRMLAINAGVMAAHAGEAGKGFGVVAESVSELAEQTASVSSNIIQRLGSLEKTIGKLLSHSQSSYDVATEALAQSDKMEEEVENFRIFGADVESLAHSISEMATPLAANDEACTRVSNDLGTLSKSTHQSFDQLQATKTRFDDLVSFTENMFLLMEESGVETEDTPLIRASMRKAQEISEIFTNAVKSGRLTLEELFDENFVPIPGSNPVQVMTKYTTFTDDVLTDLQEEHLAAHDRIAFCAAIDRNGYIPTHNKAVSKPQGDDPVWNTANCRNRRIFDDRTGLAAGQNTNPFLMQTYRRDMGGGEFIMMKDLSAPIMVMGRHWGGFRAGIKVS